MSSDQGATRFSQPLVNGQPSDAYSPGKGTYSTEAVSSGTASSSPPSSISSSGSSQQQPASGGASQRLPSSDSPQRNFTSGSQPAATSGGQGQTNTNQSYKPQNDSYKSTSDSYKQPSDSYKSSSDSYKPPGDSYKSSSDSYKPGTDSYKSTSDGYKSSSDSYKQSSDNYKSSSDSYKQSTDSYKSSSDAYKPSADSYKSSESYKSTSNAFGSSAAGERGGQSYKSDTASPASMLAASNTGSSGSNAYKSPTLDSSFNKSGGDSVTSQARPQAAAPSTTSVPAAQSIRKPESRPVINNNYQQSFQNQQRPTSGTTNFQQNAASQPPSSAGYQASSTGYQQSNYQQSYQSQRPAQAAAVPQLTRETSNTTMAPPRSASSYATPNSQNQNFQRTSQAAAPTPAQRPYTPQGSQQQRPITPVSRPHPSQSPAGPRPQAYPQSYQTSPAAQRPITQNYQQSSAVPTARVSINARPGNPPNQNLYSSNPPNYPGGVRTGPNSADIFQRAAAANFQQRHGDSLRLDQRVPLPGANRASPLANFAQVIEEEKRRTFQQPPVSQEADKLAASKAGLQSSKFKALIRKNIQPGDGEDGPPPQFQNLNIRQNLVEEAIGTYKKLESEAAKTVAKQPSNSSLTISSDIMKKLKMKKIQQALLLKVKGKGDKDKEEDKSGGEDPDGNKDEKNETRKKKKKKKKEGEEGDEEGSEEESEEEEAVERKPFVFKPPTLKEGSGTVYDNIKFFEDNDTAKVPIVPKIPVLDRRDKPPRPTSIPIDSAAEGRVGGERGVDETPVVHPNLRSISDTPLKVARIATEKKAESKTPPQPGKGGARSAPSATSYPGTPTKSETTTPKQGASAPQTPKKTYEVPHFNPEQELLSFFNDPTARSKFFRNLDIDHDSGVDEGTDRKENRPTANGDINSPKKTPSKLPGPRKSAPAGSSPTKTPVKSPGTAKSLPKTPETPVPPAPLIKKVPMNRIQVGSAPSPNLKQIKSKIGSLANTTHKPGGGNIRIESHKVDFSGTHSRIANKNDTYTPGGGDKKITHVKLQWQAKPKVGSLDNATHKPGGGDKKIENVKLDFKDKAKPRVGSKDNVKHAPGGGAVKNSTSPQEGKSPNIESQKLEFKAQSKIGSLDNVKHKPGGGDIKIFDDKTYLKQVSGGSEGRGSGAQSYGDLSVVTEVQGTSSSKPGTPDHATAIKIKKTTTIGRTRPEIKKTTEVTVVSRSPSKERKPIAKSPSTQEVKLTYQKVASPAKHKATDSESKGPVQVVNVPVKDHAPILKPGAENKDAPGLEIKNIILNFEHHINSGKDGQSSSSAGSDGKRADSQPNDTGSRPESGQSPHGGKHTDDHRAGDKENGDKHKTDKNSKNDENLRKSTQGADGKETKEETPLSKFLQNEIAAHEKVGEIWKEVQNTPGVLDGKAGTQKPGGLPAAQAPQGMTKPGFQQQPGGPQMSQSPQQRPLLQKDTQPLAGPNQGGPKTVVPTQSNQNLQNSNLPSMPPQQQSQQKPLQGQSASPAAPQGAPQGPPKPQPPQQQSAMKPNPVQPLQGSLQGSLQGPLQGPKYPATQPSSSPGQNPMMSKPAPSQQTIQNLTRNSSDLGQANIPPPQPTSQQFHGVTDKNVPKD